jgi:multidrug transporter EmrE-like cation transporter
VTRRGRAPDLSVIVPAFNESARIEACVLDLDRDLATREFTSEILVVSDGSTDRTNAILRRLGQRLRRLRVVIRPRNGGKGAAVREGLRMSRGRFAAFTDADLSTPPSEFPALLAHLRAGADLAIGSRALPASRLPVPQPFGRRVAGRIFNAAVRVVLGLPFADTQCGFKGVSGRGRALLLRESREDGFAFDVEWLLLARRHGLRAVEFPITWSDRAHSSVRLLRHAPRMFGTLLRLRRRFADAAGYHPARALPLIFFSCACAVVGQILFKTGARAIADVPFGPAFLVAMAGQPLIWGAVTAFGASAATWILALARVDLSYAFPMLSLNFIFTALYGARYLGEHLSGLRIAGIALIVGGVLVIAAGGSPAPGTAPARSRPPRRKQAR